MTTKRKKLGDRAEDCLKNSARLRRRLLSDPRFEDAAIKFTNDDDEAASEVLLNTRLYHWFSRLHMLHWTSLHPRVSHLEVMCAPVGGDHQAASSIGGRAAARSNIKNKMKKMTVDMVRHVLPVNKLHDGSLAELGQTVQLGERALLRVAEAVLEFLVVVHAHGYLHLDIKPDNIFFTFVAGGDAYRFVLGDYDMMEQALIVINGVQTTDGRRFSQGTEGYMSPLIVHDGYDGDGNNAIPRFSRVAVQCKCKDVGLRLPGTAATWTRMFQRAKDNIADVIAKVDMHSLALTLLELIPQSQDVLTRNSAMGQLLPKLMFFRRSDFRTAAEALAFVRKSLNSHTAWVKRNGTG